MPIQAVSPPPSYIAPVIIGNAVPLLGVLLWDWSVFELMFLYWAENVVIGLITLCLMLVTGLRGGLRMLVPGLFMGAFFTFHYGMFCLGHGTFVITLFYPDGGQQLDGGLFAPVSFVRDSGLWQGFFWALTGMAVVQIVQIIQNWQETGAKTPQQIMMGPYARIIILHVTLILGGMAAMAMNQPVAALIVLIALKTAFDLGLFALLRKKKTHEARRNDQSAG